MSELVPLRVEKHFKPLPQNKTLAPLRGSFIKEFPPPPTPALTGWIWYIYLFNVITVSFVVIDPDRAERRLLSIGLHPQEYIRLTGIAVNQNTKSIEIDKIRFGKITSWPNLEKKLILLKTLPSKSSYKRSSSYVKSDIIDHFFFSRAVHFKSLDGSPRSTAVAIGNESNPSTLTT